MTIDQTPARPYAIDGIFTAIKLTASESKSVSAAEKKISSLMEIISGTEPDRASNGHKSRLHLVADALEGEFISDPTPEAAERFHSALVRAEAAEKSFPRLDAACNGGMAGANRELETVIQAIGERALSALNRELETVRAGVASPAKSFGEAEELALFDARAAATREALGALLSEGLANPLPWLRSRGMIE